MLTTTASKLFTAANARGLSTVRTMSRDKIYAGAIARGLVSKETLKKQLRKDNATAITISTLCTASLAVASFHYPIMTVPVILCSIHDINKVLSKVNKSKKFLQVYARKLENARNQIRKNLAGLS